MLARDNIHSSALQWRPDTMPGRPLAHTAADVANYMSGRHAASMLERIPDGVEIYSVGPRGTVGSPDAFSVPVSKAPCCARLNEDADSLVPDPDSRKVRWASEVVVRGVGGAFFDGAAHLALVRCFWTRARA